MKKLLITLFLVVGAGVAVAGGLTIANHTHDAAGVRDVFVNGHSGGTNADGCHTNHKTGGYHCHNRK